MRELSRDIGIPKGLSGFGVREEHVGKVVEEAIKSGNVPVNPRRADADDLARILRQALSEENLTGSHAQGRTSPDFLDGVTTDPPRSQRLRGY